MPLTIDDVNMHPEWNIYPHRVQAAAAVRGKFCSAIETGVDHSRIKEFDARLGVSQEVPLTQK